jgi:hypothetical protein
VRTTKEDAHGKRGAYGQSGGTHGLGARTYAPVMKGMYKEAYTARVAVVARHMVNMGYIHKRPSLEMQTGRAQLQGRVYIWLTPLI